MAGNFAMRDHQRAQGRAYTPPMSQGWGVLGFSRFPNEASLPGASATAAQDVRHPVGSNQINQIYPTNWQWLQLRQYQCLVSRRYNIADSATKLAEQKHPFYQLATKNTGTGLGQGKLKNLNVNAQSNFTNLLARATSFGRYPNQVPVQ